MPKILNTTKSRPLQSLNPSSPKTSGIMRRVRVYESTTCPRTYSSISILSNSRSNQFHPAVVICFMARLLNFIVHPFLHNQGRLYRVTWTRNYLYPVSNVRQRIRIGLHGTVALYTSTPMTLKLFVSAFSSPESCVLNLKVPRILPIVSRESLASYTQFASSKSIVSVP